LVFIFLSGCFVESRGDDETLLRWTWDAVPKSVTQSDGTVVGATENAPAALRVSHTEAGARTIPLFKVDHPQITRQFYALVGTLRLKDVTPGSYLELWNHFPDGSAYFTRTLASAGPLGTLSGSGEGKPFALPFDKATFPAPVLLEVNLVLAGPGTVEFGPIELRQSSSSMPGMTDPGAWWSEPAAGWIGGLGGSALGILGAIVGILSSQGRARSLVLVLIQAIIACGVALLILGVVAVAQSQPWTVYYPLLLVGGLGAGIFGIQLVQLQRRYAAFELRKMAALDVR